MSMTIEEIRAQIDAAVMAYAELDDSLPGTKLSLGWVVAYEFTTEELEDRDQTACGVITAMDSQSRSTSRGVLELGVDRFRI